jgi:hypothetical protein
MKKMSDNLNGIMNDHDYRLRRLETTPTPANVLNRIVPAGGSDGDVLTKTSGTDYEMAWETSRSGYILSETIVYSTGSETFAKEYYTGIKAIRVKVQGAGGGGGGADDTTSPTYTNYTAIAGSGGGGAYAEKFITADELDEIESVTIGAGGGGGTVAGGDGTDGGDSLFGTHVICGGGVGGTGQAPVAAITGAVCGAGGEVDATTSADIEINGGTGNRGVSIPTATPNYYAYAITSTGGNSFMGHGAPSDLTSSGIAGVSGVGYGAGGRGGTNTENESTGKAGGDGTNGIVILEVYI